MVTERLTLPRGTLFADFLNTIRGLTLPRAQASAEAAAPAAEAFFVTATDDSFAEEVHVAVPVTAAGAEAGGNGVGALERQIATLKRKLDDTQKAAAS